MEWAPPPKAVYHVEGSAALKRGDGDKACPNAWFLASHGAMDILSHPCPYPIGTSRCQSWCCLGAVHDISSGLLGQKHSSWLPWVTSLAPCQQSKHGVSFGMESWKGEASGVEFCPCALFFLTCQVLLNQLCLPLELAGILAMMLNGKWKLLF